MSLLPPRKKKPGPRPQITAHTPTPREAFEAFCCLQVERIQRNLSRRYGADYDGIRLTHHHGAGNRFHVMPQNDNMSWAEVRRECTIHRKG